MQRRGGREHSRPLIGIGRAGGGCPGDCGCERFACRVDGSSRTGSGCARRREPGSASGRSAGAIGRSGRARRNPDSGTPRSVSSPRPGASVQGLRRCDAEQCASDAGSVSGASPEPDTAAISELRWYARLTTAHGEALTKLLPVFDTLYQSMSDPQKKAADKVFAQLQQRRSPRQARTTLFLVGGTQETK